MGTCSEDILNINKLGRFARYYVDDAKSTGLLSCVGAQQAFCQTPDGHYEFCLHDDTVNLRFDYDDLVSHSYIEELSFKTIKCSMKVIRYYRSHEYNIELSEKINGKYINAKFIKPYEISETNKLLVKLQKYNPEFARKIIECDY